jgi:tRNA A-37 threonylcarbamoyl transferase component Bud32
MEFEIKGHSGCSITIENSANDEGLYVIKSTDDKAYVRRLLSQAEKQTFFYKKGIKSVNVPRIFEIREGGGNNASFKMEFVYSLNFVDFFEKISIADIDNFIRTIIDFIDNEIRLSEIEVVDSNVIVNKYNDVKEKISLNDFLKNNIHVKELLKKTDDVFQFISAIELPVGLCHGDLTFSNILFNGQKICLIDFLDSFLESPLIDVVKIRQDTYYFWSLLMYTKKCDIPRMKMILKYIDNKINEYYKQYTWYCNYYMLFQQLNLLRVLQYAKKEDVVDFLLKAIMTTI